MARGELTSAWRSVRRWLTYVLPEPLSGEWTVLLADRLEHEQEDARPTAVVAYAADPETTGMKLGGGGWAPMRAVTWSVAVYAAPAPSSEEAAMHASDIAEALTEAVVAGLVDTATNTYVSKPGQLPLYNFEGVPITGTGRRGPESPYAAMDVITFGFRPVPDIDDTKLFSVVGTLRTRWTASGPLPLTAGQPLVAAIPGDYDPALALPDPRTAQDVSGTFSEP